MKYTVIVKPGSSQEKIIASGETLTVYLRAKPHDGEANQALVKLLSEHLKTPKTRIQILRGTKSRHKIISVESD